MSGDCYFASNQVRVEFRETVKRCDSNFEVNSTQILKLVLCNIYLALNNMFFNSATNIYNNDQPFNRHILFIIFILVI